MATFQELKPVRKADSNTLGVFFVHGLQNSKTKALRKSLKAWLRGIDLPNTRIISMGFDTTELLTKGNKILVTLSDALLKHIRHLQRSETYIFIAHGIAGWVVKESLSRIDSHDLASRAGIIFLGSLHNDPTDWTTFTESFLTQASKDFRHDGALVKERELVYRKSIKVLPKRRKESPAPSSLTIGFLQNVVESNFILMCKQYMPVTEYIDSQPQSNQTDIRLAPIKTRRTDLSQDSSFSTEQLVKLSLMDVQPNTQEDQRIRSLLKTRMSREKRFSTDTANAGLGGLPNGWPTTPQKGYVGQTAFPKLPSMRRKASTEVVDNIPTRIRSTIQPQRNLMPSEKSNDLGTIQSSESHKKSETEKQEPTQEGEDSTKMKMVLASVYHKCGKLEAARIVYEEMLSPSPTSRFSETHQLRSVIRCRVAEIHLQEGRFEEAEKHLSQLEMESRKMASENGNITWVTLEISRWLGITFDKRGKFEEAYQKLEALEREIEEVKEERRSGSKRLPDLEKYSMLTKNALSLVFAHMGDFARAIATSDDAIQIARRTDGAADYSKHNTMMELNRAIIFAYNGDYRNATSISQVVAKKLERQYGAKNLATLECWSLQTQLLAANSMPDEAQDRAEVTLQGMRNELGKEHPLTLELLGTLVLIHLSQGRIADAMETAQYVFQANTRSHALGPDHPQTINSMNILATVKPAAGQIQDAESLQMEVVRQAEVHLGKHHPSTVSYKLNLASIYCHMGNWAKSREITGSIFWMQWNHFLNASSKIKTDQDIVTSKDSQSILKVLRTSDYSLLNVHPSFLSTIHCLGVAERELDNGDLSAARELLSKVASLREERFGATHVDTLWSQFELAKAERECGGIENLREASRIFEMVLTERRKLLGESHPDTLSARHDLSITKFQMGHEDEAAEEHAKVLSLRTKILGTHHPDTIRSKLDLAKVYQSLGDMGEAENLQLAALGEQIRQSKLIELGLTVADEDHKRHLYALILDRFASNQSTNSNTATIKTREQPLYCHEIIAAVADLAFTYVGLDDTAKRESAADIQKIVVSLQEQYLGNNALKTLVSVNGLGLIYQALDRTQDAITQFYRVCHNTSPDLPLHLASQSNLASSYFVVGDIKRAESIQKTVLDSQRASMSKDPKALIESMFNLALMMKERAKKEGGTPIAAIDLMKEVVQLSEKLGHEHPLHMEMYDTLAEWQDLDEDNEENGCFYSMEHKSIHINNS